MRRGSIPNPAVSLLSLFLCAFTRDIKNAPATEPRSVFASRRKMPCLPSTSRIHAFQRRLRDARKQSSDSVELLRRIREARANQQLLDDEPSADLEEAGNRRPPGAGSSSNSSSSSSWSRSGRDGGRRKP